MISAAHRRNFLKLADVLEKGDHSIDTSCHFSNTSVWKMYVESYDTTTSDLLKAFNLTNSTCSLLGLAAITSGIDRRSGEDAEDHCYRVFGVYPCSDMVDTGDFSFDGEEGPWDFIFSHRWNNDKNQAIARLRYLAKFGRAPMEFCFNDQF